MNHNNNLANWLLKTKIISRSENVSIPLATMKINPTSSIYRQQKGHASEGTTTSFCQIISMA